jgi:large subunit ribosomal protein L30
MEEKRKCLVAIRVRGVSGLSYEIRDTLKMLHLTRNCHATLIDDRPSYIGMLKKAQNCLVWGEISKEHVTLLLKKRGRLVGDEKLTKEHAQELGYKSLDDLAEAAYKLEVEYSRLLKVKPVFRLHPPKKGFKGKIKRSYAAGGVTGYQGDAINSLLERMM